jgi:hypothetical protein
VSKPKRGPAWDGRTRLPVAILVDVDGTLAGICRGGKRELRPSAVEGLRLLAARAPVFLWSIAGRDNGNNLLCEFPVLRALVQGAYGKDEFPLDRVDRSYAIDDDAVDDAVRRCHVVAKVDSDFWGPDPGQFLEAVDAIVADLKRRE